MECRSLEINVMYARDLKNVRTLAFKNMVVYAVVSISGDTQPEQRTPVDENSGDNPTWNSSMKFTINESAARKNLLTLEFRLFCQRTMGDREIGVVDVPVKDLLDTIGGGNPPSKEVLRKVKTPSGTVQGELKFSYRFGQVFKGPAYQPPPPVAQPQPAQGFELVKQAASEVITSAAATFGLTAATNAAAGTLGLNGAAATNSATDAAAVTLASTDAATKCATDAATNFATDAATNCATDAAAVTLDSTEAVTLGSTDAATNCATDAAAVTLDSTDDAATNNEEINEEEVVNEDAVNVDHEVDQI